MFSFDMPNINIFIAKSFSSATLFHFFPGRDDDGGDISRTFILCHFTIDFSLFCLLSCDKKAGRAESTLWSETRKIHNFSGRFGDETSGGKGAKSTLSRPVSRRIEPSSSIKDMQGLGWWKSQ